VKDLTVGLGALVKVLVINVHLSGRQIVYSDDVRNWDVCATVRIYEEEYWEHQPTKIVWERHL